MFSLHAEGFARLIFRPITERPIFEGVLITDDNEDTLGVVGNLNKMTEDPKRFFVDLNVTDGETGQLYIVRRVQLKITDSDKDANAQSQPNADGEMAVDAGIIPDAIETAPTYELHSDVLRFSTDEVLVGNRADKDISTYLNPLWIGQRLRVYFGRMSIHLTAAITPPATPSLEEKRKHQISFSGDDATGDEIEAPLTDADVNFLM